MCSTSYNLELPRALKPEHPSSLGSRGCWRCCRHVLGSPCARFSRPSGLLLSHLPRGAPSALTPTSRHSACGRWDPKWLQCRCFSPREKGLHTVGLFPGWIREGLDTQVLLIRAHPLAYRGSHLTAFACCVGAQNYYWSAVDERVSCVLELNQEADADSWLHLSDVEKLKLNLA